MSVLLYGCTTWMLTQADRVKDCQQLHKDATSYIKHILEAASHKKAAVQLPTTQLEDHPNQTNKTCRDTAGGVWMNS